MAQRVEYLVEILPDGTVKIDANGNPGRDFEKFAEDLGKDLGVTVQAERKRGAQHVHGAAELRQGGHV